MHHEPLPDAAGAVGTGPVGVGPVGAVGMGPVGTGPVGTVGVGPNPPAVAGGEGVIGFTIGVVPGVVGFTIGIFPGLFTLSVRGEKKVSSSSLKSRFLPSWFSMLASEDRKKGCI